MPTNDAIRQQQELLQTNRKHLHALLKQQRKMGVHTPAFVNTEIDEYRDDIARIKATLRGWRVAVENHPDDEGSNETAPVGTASTHQTIHNQAPNQDDTFMGDTIDAQGSQGLAQSPVGSGAAEIGKVWYKQTRFRGRHSLRATFHPQKSKMGSRKCIAMNPSPLSCPKLNSTVRSTRMPCFPFAWPHGFRRSISMFIITSLLLVFVSPIFPTSVAHSQNELKEIQYQGISFSFDPSLATAVMVEEIPEERIDDLLIHNPQHTRFTFQKYLQPASEERSARISVFNADETQTTSTEVRRIQSLISERPDLRSRYPTYLPSGNDYPPYFPSPYGLLMLGLQMKYQDFHNGAGIRYITTVWHDEGPMSGIPGLEYTFQGTTHDGKYYIAASFAIFPDTTEDTLPSCSTGPDFRACNEEVAQQLEQIENYSPQLATLDAIIASLQVSSEGDDEETAPPEDDTLVYEHEALRFTYSSSVATNIVAETVPEQGATDAWQAWWLPPYPEHTRFQFDGYPTANTEAETILWERPQLALFPVQSYPDAAEEVSQLQALLEQKAALSPEDVEAIPMVPPVEMIYFVANIEFLDFVHGSGVRYITYISTEGGIPIDGNNLIYTFQGITDDGQFYLSATFPVSSNLPPSPRNNPALLDTYNKEVIQQLDQQDASAFELDLTLLDAIMKSLEVRSNKAPDESAEPSGDGDPSGEIAYIHEENIWLLDLTTQEKRQLTYYGGVRGPLSWSPDGQWLFFSSNRESWCFWKACMSTHDSIYKLPIEDYAEAREEDNNLYEDGRISQTNDHRSEQGAVLASDGTLFFSRYNIMEDPNSPRLAYNQMVIQQDPDGTETIIEGSETAISSMRFHPEQLSLSPDENLLAVTYTAAAFVFDTVDIIDLTTGNIQSLGQILNETPSFDNAKWAHRHAQMVASTRYTALGESNPSVYLLDFTSEPPESMFLFEANAPIQMLDWSPDDQWIIFDQQGAFNEERDDWQSSLWMISAEGGEPQQVAPVGSYPAWRPSGAIEAVSAQSPSFSLLYTGDLYGRLQPWVNTDGEHVGGMANIAGVVEQIRTEHPHTILVDSGDTWQGTPLSNRNGGELMVQVMNRMHYDAWVPGNHDFDQGQDNMRDRIASADFVPLAANIMRDGKHWDVVKPEVVLTVGEIRVGVFGLAHPDTPLKTNRSSTDGLQFEDAIAAAQRQVSRLSTQADCIVVISHLDSAGNRVLAEQVDGIDIIVGEDTHQIIDEVVGNTRILAAGQHGEFLGHANVTLHADGSLDIQNTVIPVLDGKTSGPSTSVSTMIEEHWNTIAGDLTKVLGQTEIDLLPITEAHTGNEFPFGNLVVDAILDAQPPDGWEPDVALFNSNSIRAAIPKGDVTRYQIETAFPFPNQIVYLKMSGKQLQSVIEESTDQISVAGMRYTHAPEDRNDVQNIIVGDRLLDQHDQYVVATIDYLSEGGGGWDVVTHNIPTEDRVTDEALVDIIARYFEQYSPVSPDVEGRIIPAPTSIAPSVEVHPQTQSQLGRLFQPGYQFSPNSTVTLHFQPVGGAELSTATVETDQEGHYRHSYTGTCDRSPGFYEYWAVDDTTGIASERVRFQIAQSAACQPGYQPPTCEADFEQLIPGDILLYSEGLGDLTQFVDWSQTLSYGGAWHHTALYVGDGMVTGAGTSGVETASLQKDYYQQAHYCALYRVNTDAETRQRAIDIVQEQTGKPYHYLLVDKQRTDEFQCAHLIWYAYHEASGGAIDLDENLGTPTWLNSLFPDLIIPDDLALNQNVSFVSGDLDFHAFSVGGFSPITLLVTDAQGRRAGIDPETGQVVNEIPGALFDMHAEPKYLVIPDAQPETYTITVVGTNDGEYTLRMTQVSPEEGIQEHEQSDTIAPGEQHTVTINLGEEEDDSDMAATSPAPAATPAPAAPTVVSSSGKGGGACLNMGFVVTIGLVAMVIGRKRFLVRNPQSRRDNGS